MNASPETKVCPFCAETVRLAAKICPHCQSKLGRYARWQYEIGITIVILVLFGEWIVLMALIAPDDQMKGRAFAGHQADLLIEQMSLESVGKRAEFFFSGVVTNIGDYPWRVREIEVRFRATNGDLIEVQHPKINEPFVVQPAQEAPFRIPLSRLHPDVLTASLEGRVQDASDGNRARDPD